MDEPKAAPKIPEFKKEKERKAGIPWLPVAAPGKSLTFAIFFCSKVGVLATLGAFIGGSIGISQLILPYLNSGDSASFDNAAPSLERPRQRRAFKVDSPEPVSSGDSLGLLQRGIREDLPQQGVPAQSDKSVQDTAAAEAAAQAQQQADAKVKQEDDTRAKQAAAQAQAGKIAEALAEGAEMSESGKSGGRIKDRMARRFGSNLSGEFKSSSFGGKDIFAGTPKLGAGLSSRSFGEVNDKRLAFNGRSGRLRPKDLVQNAALYRTRGRNVSSKSLAYLKKMQKYNAPMKMATTGDQLSDIGATQFGKEELSKQAKAPETPAEPKLPAVSGGSSQGGVGGAAGGPIGGCAEGTVDNDGSGVCGPVDVLDHAQWAPAALEAERVVRRAIDYIIAASATFFFLWALGEAASRSPDPITKGLAVLLFLAAFVYASYATFEATMLGERVRSLGMEMRQKGGGQQLGQDVSSIGNDIKNFAWSSITVVGGGVLAILVSEDEADLHSHVRHALDNTENHNREVEERARRKKEKEEEEKGGQRAVSPARP